MIQMAGEAFDISNWKIVYYLGDKIGLLCPQLYPDELRQGSIFYIGIFTPHRGQNHGTTLHAHGLNLLIEQGAKEYIGSTNIKNKAMLRIFKTNKCTEKYIQLFFKQ